MQFLRILGPSVMYRALQMSNLEAVGQLFSLLFKWTRLIYRLETPFALLY